ncbi:hypothetical protein BD779DRAFT_658321 [Infundibulicybe gibba]|nr:hypothetical protein BD779DRAFT_658321 [Infundibulicybe gibba]
MSKAITTSDNPNSSQLDIALPGCGLPLNHNAQKLFKNGLNANDCYDGEYNVVLPLITLRECLMLRLMDEMSDKPNWDTEVFDENIASQWKAEVLKSSLVDAEITSGMAEWCIEELRYKAKNFQRTGAISVYTGDVVKSDTIVPEVLRHALKTAVAPLEDIPESLQDWRPGSNGTILDLVDPSLYPVTYGRTQILADGLTTLDDFIDQCGNGRVLDVPSGLGPIAIPLNTATDVLSLFSSKFQWLPCEVNVSGERARITSYINNLDPQYHQNLYHAIEKVISCAIPMWNMALRPLGSEEYRYCRITYGECTYYPDPAIFPPSEGPQIEEGEGEDEYRDRRQEWVRETRCVVQPDLGRFQPPSVPKSLRAVDLQRDFGHQGLQIIIKLTNIHLTPEKPEYRDETWKFEGRLNEHICATALYYYDSVNTTMGHLGFRQQCDCLEPNRITYEQYEYDWLNAIFGVELDEPAVQEIGSIKTKEGRLITFPNILQYQVQPFSLADLSKPGHCKVLTLCLVDPNIRIISTANVPCQRRDWWREKAIKNGPHRLRNLPLELQDLIFKEVDEFPISMEEAKEIRLELIDERRAYDRVHSMALTANVFSLP